MLWVGQQNRRSSISGSASECFCSPAFGTSQEEVAVSTDLTSLVFSQVGLHLDDLAMDGRDQGQIRFQTPTQPTLFADGLLISDDRRSPKLLQQLLQGQPRFRRITFKHLDPSQTEPVDLPTALQSVAEPENGLPLIIFLDHADQRPDLIGQISRLLRPRMRLVIVAMVDDLDPADLSRLYEAGAVSVVRRPVDSAPVSRPDQTNDGRSSATADSTGEVTDKTKTIEAWWEQLAGYWLATQGVDRTAGAKGVGV